MKDSITDSIIVGFDSSKNGDNTVLIVGRKRLNNSVYIINAFEGDEALELYRRLVTKKDDQNV